MNSKRNPIDFEKINSNLILSDKNTIYKFNIKAILDDTDDTAITYKALFKGRSGKLKEFYPHSLQDNQNITAYRQGDNLLCFKTNDPDQIQFLQNAYHKFLRPYQEHTNTIQTELPIPRIKIYEANDKFKDEAYFETAYIWTADETSGSSFTEYIDNQILNASLESNEKLQTFLKLLLEVIEYVQMPVFSQTEEYFLNISPDNFQILSDSEFKLMESRIVLDEINFLYSEDIGLSKAEYVGREIGSLLCRFLEINPESLEQLSRAEIYRKIRQAPIIKSSQENSNLKITNNIADFLEFSHSENLTDIEELTNSLKRILDEMKRLNYSNPSVPKTISKSSETDNSFIEFYRKFSIADTLFKHPFQYGESNISSLVFGMGNNGQACIDTLLQLGQIIRHIPEIKVLVHDSFLEKSKKNYLQNRPALKRFTKIDKDFDSQIYHFNEYARLYFKDTIEGPAFDHPVYKPYRESQDLRKKLEQILLAPENRKYTAIFFCFGNDNLNQALAEIAFRILESSSISKVPAIYYIVGNPENFDKSEDLINGPIPINISTDKDRVGDFLKEIAFNINFIWRDTPNNINISREFGKFNDNAYHFSSSILSAIGLINNLEELGIQANPYKHLDMDVTTDTELQVFFETAAKQFYDTYIKDATERKQKALKKLEVNAHKNWLFGKLTEGWNAPLKEGSYEIDYELLNNLNHLKDKQKKLHPRILPTKTGAGEIQKRFPSFSDWNKYKPKKDRTLDPIDKYSLNLNLAYSQRYERDRSIPIGQNEELYLLKKRLKHKGQALNDAFEALYECLRKSHSGSVRYSRKFNYYYYNLRDLIKELNDENLKSELLHYLEKIRDNYLPMIRSNQYRDYKTNNYKIIHEIPFILTNTRNKELVQLFELPDKNQNNAQTNFENILSASLLLPSYLTYLVLLESEESIKTFLKNLKVVSDFFDNRGLDTKINLIIYLDPDLLRSEKNFSNLILNYCLDFKRIDDVLILDEEELEIFDLLKPEDQDIIKENHSRLLKLNLIQALFYLRSPEDITHLRLDSKLKEELFKSVDINLLELLDKITIFDVDPQSDKRFTAYETEDLDYTDTSNSYLTVREVLNLTADSTSIVSFIPDLEIETFNILWNIYNGTRKEVYTQKKKQRSNRQGSNTSSKTQTSEEKREIQLREEKLHLKREQEKKRTDKFPLKIKLQNKNAPEAWEELTQNLQYYHLKNPEQLVTIKYRNNIKSEDSYDLGISEFYLPVFTLDTAEEILKILKEKRLIENTSEITNWTTDTIKVTFVLNKNKGEETLEKLKTLFSNPYALANPDIMRIYSYLSDMNYLVFETIPLKVNKIGLNKRQHYTKFKTLRDGRKEYKEYPNLNDTLDYLNADGFITMHKEFSYRNNPKKNFHNFNYSSLPILDLLTTPALMVIFKLYFMATATNYFDDVECVYEYQNASSLSFNKTPYLILTKGFKVFIIGYDNLPIEGVINDEFSENRMKKFQDKYLFNSTGIIIENFKKSNRNSFGNHFKIFDIENFSIEEFIEYLKNLDQ